MTGAADIRLLIADVDGTLVTHDKVLTPAARAAARGLRKAGIGLALTSARPPRGMRMLIEPLGLQLPLAGFNGGLIVDPTLQPLERHPLAPAAAKSAIKALRDADLDIWIYTDTTWFVSRLDGPHVQREAWIIEIDPAAMPPSDAWLDHTFKIVGVSDDHPKVAAAEAAVQRRLGAAASATRSEPHFLDVTDIRATKGFVARSLAQRLSLARTQIATIGDMPNDVLMFRESGLSIAMGNAGAAVKAQADAVTDSNEDDGFAKAINAFLLAPTAPCPKTPEAPP